MLIKKLKLTNFRNYKSLNISFDERVNIFVGHNAQGKTNILEAIYLLATAKSFRASKESEMINHHQNRCLVLGNVVTEATHELELVFSTNASKILKFNNKDTPQKEFVGVFNVVLFTPDDLYLVKGSPGGRRKFLDWEISQVDMGYRNLLSDYNRILNHRNSLLKKIMVTNQDAALLEVWDQQLIDIGSRLMLKRSEMIYRLGLLSRLMHRQLSDGQEELMLRYLPFFSLQNEPGRYTYDLIYERFNQALNEAKSDELKRGYTLVGPQRDDFQFLINNLDAKTYGSQGQQRTAVLSCRLAELEYMKSETGSYPVILLDDVMSELDSLRKHFLLKLLQKKVQTIITTTDISDFEPELTTNSGIFVVNAGQVQERR